jgi:hypothetical protein
MCFGYRDIDNLSNPATPYSQTLAARPFGQIGVKKFKKTTK